MGISELNLKLPYYDQSPPSLPLKVCCTKTENVFDK